MALDQTELAQIVSAVIQALKVGDTGAKAVPAAKAGNSLEAKGSSPGRRLQAHAFFGQFQRAAARLNGSPRGGHKKAAQASGLKSGEGSNEEQRP